MNEKCGKSKYAANLVPSSRLLIGWKPATGSRTLSLMSCQRLAISDDHYGSVRYSTSTLWPAHLHFNVKFNSKTGLFSSTFWFGRIFCCKTALLVEMQVCGSWFWIWGSEDEYHRALLSSPKASIWYPDRVRSSSISICIKFLSFSFQNHNRKQGGFLVKCIALFNIYPP